MAERSFPLENTLYTAEEASLWFATRTSGVHASNSLGVSAGSNMTVIVGTGVAWLKYAEYTGVSYANTESKTLVVPAANGNYPRIDRVVLRYSKSENRVYLAIRSGTPESTPKVPNIVRDSSTYEISLAQVYVAANATSITASNITDERLNNAVCGLMSDGVTPYINEGGNGGLPATEDSAHPGCYYLLANGTLEWLNPPMSIGVEYRTTERIAGKPVYTKFFNMGTFPVGTTSVKIADNIGTWKNVVCITDGNGDDLTESGYINEAHTNGNYIVVNVSTSTTLLAVVRYIKSTD